MTASRIGTLLGVVLYGVFLEWFDWRLVFVLAVVIGLVALWFSYPILKHRERQREEERAEVNINYPSAALLVATLAVFVLSGSHLHDGAESFTTPEARGYHIPMHLLTLALFGLFFVVQSMSREPFLDFRYFRRKYFSMALFSNTTFHLSMLTVFTLVPIVVEGGLGYSPIVVSTVLLCHQSFGLWISAPGRADLRPVQPAVAGAAVPGLGGNGDRGDCVVRSAGAHLGAAHAAASRFGGHGAVHIAL